MTFLTISEIRNDFICYSISDSINLYKLNQYPDKSYREMVDKMRENFLIQLDWMNEKISNM